MPELILRYFRQGLEELETSADHTELLKVWEKRAGVELNTGTPDSNSAVVRKD